MKCGSRGCEDELDIDLYRTCLQWCREEGIGSISDLKDAKRKQNKSKLIAKRIHFHKKGPGKIAHGNLSRSLYILLKGQIPGYIRVSYDYLSVLTEYLSEFIKYMLGFGQYMSKRILLF
jgi:hypothetical protein